jgi:predicted oxidoreductase
MNFGGTWEPGSDYTEEAFNRSRAALETALELRWNVFDHADIYGRGRSEAIFGKLLQDLRLSRDALIIQTKCGIRFADEPVQGMPHRYDFSAQHIRESLENSLRRLQTDYVDIFLLHRPDFLADPDEIVSTLDALKSEGKLRHAGVSNFTPFQMDVYADAGFVPVANQVEISLRKPALIDCGLVAQDARPADGHPGDGTLEWHRRKGVVTQAWAPLAYGYLSGRKPKTDDPGLKAGAKYVRELAEEKGVAEEAIVIAWLLRHPAAIQPIIGTLDPQRLRNCAHAVDCELSREEWYQLHRVVRAAPLA